MSSSKAVRLEFNDKFITAVQKRPILWECGRADYKDQRKKSVAWEEVAAEIGCDLQEANLPGRWKSLRDTFTKKLRMQKTGAPSGSGAKEGKKAKEVTWPYFTMLKFLKDETEIDSTISNITDPECTDESPQALLAAIYSDTAELEEEEVVVHDVPASSYLEESSLDDTTQSSSHDTSHTTVPERATPRRKKTTKSKNRWEEELSQVDKAIAAQSDQASLYGQMLASKLRSCPKRMKQVMELDLLDFFKRYTFEEEPE
ncbi:uncharacterized protein LOC144142266 [Haemaphysalis longicornis]